MSWTLSKPTNQGCLRQPDGHLMLHEKSRWHLLLFPTLRHMKQTFRARAKHLLTSDFSFLHVTVIQGTNTMQYNERYIGAQTTFRLHHKLQGSHLAHLCMYYGSALQQLPCLKIRIHKPICKRYAEYLCCRGLISERGVCTCTYQMTGSFL